ncbi:hypothetical protein HEQ72_10910 [Haematospirillum sp. 15-248]|uniref:hypothetical protein n=1 Tax=Haematospirillum sp. 15-248 TaxID=2723107 RepID=UPI00143B6A51|nr:hypothetical protein [Haematospirillum sp. 15-248]NKD88808.1 hypothetical protein [Haematospirillum sp. 15-248]
MTKCHLGTSEALGEDMSDYVRRAIEARLSWTGAAERKIARSLNIKPTRDWGT